jgi:hypothetical protein
MEAHIRAMKTMTSFLVLFIMYFLSNLLLMLAYSIVHGVVAKIFAHVLIFCIHLVIHFFWFYGIANWNTHLSVSWGSWSVSDSK